jgi:hypothetical protein
MRVSGSQWPPGSGRAAVFGIVALAAVVAVCALVVRSLTTGKDSARPPITQANATSPSAATSPDVRERTVDGAGGAGAHPVAPEAAPRPLFEEAFDAPLSFGGKWAATREGDFSDALTDVLDGRLRVRVGTMGTRDDTVKHLGIRSTGQVVDFATPVEIAAEIDWNDQANGCYLQASLFFCPTATDTTASSEPDWLEFEYVGVPPGRNARAVVARRSGGQLRMLFTEGWPDKQRTGRPIGRQQVVLRLGPETAEVSENGKLLCGPVAHGCAFRQAFLYVEVCSHSNYPPRTIFFDNIAVRRIR